MVFTVPLSSLVEVISAPPTNTMYGYNKLKDAKNIVWSYGYRIIIQNDAQKIVSKCPVLKRRINMRVFRCEKHLYPFNICVTIQELTHLKVGYKLFSHEEIPFFFFNLYTHMIINKEF